MASYDNLMAEQFWSYTTAFSDVYTKESDALTKALQSSFAGDFFPAGILEPLFAKPDTTPVQTPTVSGVSENEALVSKQRRSVPPSGRVAKRKSRASKRAATTTFISADPENFMQMVQQVTGVRFGGLSEQLPAAPVMKPELHRAAADGLATLDTSALFLDGGTASSLVVSQPSAAVANGGAGSSVHYFDSFCSFPTLESWKAVE